LIRTIVYERGIFRAWFDGLTFHTLSTGIGYAESIDGITWKLSEKPVVVPSTTKPTVTEPTVIKHNDTYYLYYTVLIGNAELASREIWLMTSTNGFDWKDRGCVLKRRHQISWESQGMTKPAVFVYGKKLQMYYTAAYMTGQGFGVSCLGLAQSLNGIDWTQPDDVPTLSAHQTMPWTTVAISGPSVELAGNQLTLWFSTYSQEVNRWSIWRAERTLSPVDQ
jgi:predicted GH43/DUF377 family glycosyl hydrolase